MMSLENFPMIPFSPQLESRSIVFLLFLRMCLSCPSQGREGHTMCYRHKCSTRSSTEAKSLKIPVARPCCLILLNKIMVKLEVDQTHSMIMSIPSVSAEYEMLIIVRPQSKTVEL